jgi:hypothetical protein
MAKDYVNEKFTFLKPFYILSKGPSINYVISKSAIFDPLPPS